MASECDVCSYVLVVLGGYLLTLVCSYGKVPTDL